MSFARFQEIVQRLTTADTWDQDALTQVAAELEELEVIVAAIRRPELTGLLEISSGLVALVPKLDPIEAEDCRRMVVRLIQIALRRLHALRNARKKNLAGKKRPANRESESSARPGMAIGDVLVQMGFVTTEDVERALAVSKMKGRMLGEVLVQMGKCEREDVARAVFLQKSLRPTDDKQKQENEEESEEKNEGLKDMLLGEAMLRRGWINPEELLDALRLHKHEGIKIGEALIRCGYANMEQIRQALTWQTEMRAKIASKQEVPKAYRETGTAEEAPRGAAPQTDPSPAEGHNSDSATDEPSRPKPPQSPLPSQEFPATSISFDPEE